MVLSEIHLYTNAASNMYFEKLIRINSHRKYIKESKKLMLKIILIIQDITIEIKMRFLPIIHEMFASIINLFTVNKTIISINKSEIVSKAVQRIVIIFHPNHILLHILEKQL